MWVRRGAAAPSFRPKCRTTTKVSEKGAGERGGRSEDWQAGRCAKSSAAPASLEFRPGGVARRMSQSPISAGGVRSTHCEDCDRVRKASQKMTEWRRTPLALMSNGPRHGSLLPHPTNHCRKMFARLSRYECAQCVEPPCGAGFRDGTSRRRISRRFRNGREFAVWPGDIRSLLCAGLRRLRVRQSPDARQRKPDRAL